MYKRQTRYYTRNSISIIALQNSMKTGGDMFSEKGQSPQICNYHNWHLLYLAYPLVSGLNATLFTVLCSSCADTQQPRTLGHDGGDPWSTSSLLQQGHKQDKILLARAAGLGHRQSRREIRPGNMPQTKGRVSVGGLWVLIRPSWHYWL